METSKLKKFVLGLGGLFLAFVIFGGIYYYLKQQDRDYDALMSKAAKKQKEHSEFSEFYGETEPVIPSKEANSRTLLGIDSNGNGVRDDLDVWINRNALTQNENLAMKQYARARQEWLRVCDQKKPEEVLVINQRMESADKCLATVSDYKRRENGYAKTKMEILILNIKSRTDCHEFYASQSKVKPIEMGKSLNFNCDFVVQYPQNVVSGNEEWGKNSSK